MSDTELEKEWQPTGRPQSTMARSFALALDDLFKLDSSLTDLDAVVSEKKKEIDSQTSELEQLEARLKATEERLKARQAAVSPGGSPPSKTAVSESQEQETPTSPSPLEGSGNKMAQESEAAEVSGESRPSPATKQDSSYSTTTALASQMPGALPPTPGASEGEYEYPNTKGAHEREEFERSIADYVFVPKDGDVPPTGTE